MKNTRILLSEFQNQIHNDLLTDIYIDTDMLPYHINRYRNAIQIYEKAFGSGEAAIYSAPGRSEIGGNHTDHQLFRSERYWQRPSTMMPLQLSEP